ncbi:MAG: methyl-accepting chemotaxis protein, partial [Pseudomonadota bacterium]
SDLSSRTVSVSNEAGEMLTELVPNIQRTADLVSDISTAMQEQSIGADQISDSITQLNDAIQENASFANETSAVSVDLHQQSDALSNAVSYFSENDTSRATPGAGVDPTLETTEEDAQAA